MQDNKIGWLESWHILLTKNLLVGVKKVDVKSNVA